MEMLKKILVKIIFPPVWFVVFIAPIATALLIYAFVGDGVSDMLKYFAYFLSAYALTVVCTKAPQMYRTVKDFKDENRYVNLYMNDAHLRVKISLYISVAMNAIYSVFQLVLGIYHASVWFYALAMYYFCLVLMRFFLLRDIRSTIPGENMAAELKRYRFCGIVLLCINLALAVIVFYITWQNRGFRHHYITTIAMAAYTFTAFTLAIINLVKYRKYKSPVISATKVIGLASATVSVLTLETAMLTAFGEEGQEFFRQIMTALTGAAVCVFVLVLAIFMIIKSTKELKKHRINIS
ncbi:MAG: hypothetical protein IJ316_05145 [Clostridia bacterium]|nr:hypothetical protein [Clostridia bacterium]